MASDAEEQVLELIGDPENIRNFGTIAHIDHGKTTYSDNLLARAGMISEDLAGTQLFMDYDEQESERGITIYSANVSMVHELEGQKYLINLIDTPGHVDFGGDVTRAMRAVDGAVVLVDAVEGSMPQTETVLRQAIKERVKPVLFINKSDRLISELKLSAEEIQQRFTEVIAEVNQLIRRIAPNDEIKENWTVSVEDGTVAFGSALQNWAISLPYMERTGKGFQDIIDYTQNDNVDELAEELPLHEVTLEMIIKHLPDPKTAQQYRIPEIWKGDLDSDAGQAMVNCDPDSDPVGVVTNVESDEHAGTICTVRLFAGTIDEGEEVYGIQSRKTERSQQVGVYSGPRKMKLPQVPCGNIIALTGTDFSTGETVVGKDLRIQPFEQIEHLFEPVVTKSIEAKKTSDLPKLIEALRNRAKEDQTIKVEIDEETGETLVSGLGELHIEAKVERFLREKGIDIEVSPPIVVYRESIQAASDEIQGKSPNRHNKLYFTVEPVEEDAAELLHEGELPQGKVRSQDEEDIRDALTEAGMEKEDASNVMYIHNGNMLINKTRGIQALQEIEEYIMDALHDLWEEGPLANEPCVRLKVKLHDAKLHEDAIHRGPAQIGPAVRNAVIRGMLQSQPTVYEPLQVLRIDCPTDVMGDAMTEINNRRGQILDMNEEESAAILKAKLPVAELFGFEAALKSATAGKGYFSLIDQVFEPLPKNLQEDTVLNIRKRKGMKQELPKPQDFT